MGATVLIYDVQTGRKYQLKTNSKGEYFSIGIAIGTYKFSLLQNGTTIDEHNNVPIGGGGERVVPFDLAKDAGAAAPAGGVTEEQRRRPRRPRRV